MRRAIGDVLILASGLRLLAGPRQALSVLGAGPETAVRGGGAPSPLRFGAAESGASIGRRARRLIGAPTAPPPPRCAIRPRARAARLSPARREQAGDGRPPLHAAGARHGAPRVAGVCADLNLRRL